MTRFTNDLARAFATRVGRFEWAVLRTIKEHPDDAYCAQIARYLSKNERREVSMGQVSRTLAVLREMGALISEPRYVDPPEKNQRHRLVHELTDVGRHLLHWLGDAAPIPPIKEA